MRDARKMRLLMILMLVVCFFAVGCANPAPSAERFVSEESFTVRFYVFNGSSYSLGIDDEHNKYVVSGIAKNETVALPTLDGVKGWAVFSVVPRGIIRENDSGITVFDSNSHIIGDTDVYAVYAAPQAVEPEPEPEPESGPEVETYIVRFFLFDGDAGEYRIGTGSEHVVEGVSKGSTVELPDDPVVSYWTVLANCPTGRICEDSDWLVRFDSATAVNGNCDAYAVYPVDVSAERILRYEENESGDIVITGLMEYDGVPLDIVIPEEIDSKKVVEVMDYAFQLSRNLKSVVLPNNLEKIGDCAFANCSNLEKLEFADLNQSKLHSIGKHFISGCDSLGKFYLPVNYGDSDDAVMLTSDHMQNGWTSVYIYHLLENNYSKLNYGGESGGWVFGLKCYNLDANSEIEEMLFAGDFDYEESGQGMRLVGLTQEGEEQDGYFIIPDEIEGKPVIQMSASLFAKIRRAYFPSCFEKIVGAISPANCEMQSIAFVGLKKSEVKSIFSDSLSISTNFKNNGNPDMTTIGCLTETGGGTLCAVPRPSSMSSW